MKDMIIDAILAIALATLLWLFVGCGPPQFTNINSRAEVSFARWQAERHFGTELTAAVFLADPATIAESCQAAVAACYSFNVIRISGPSPFDICQQTMHEFGHEAELRLDQMVDPTHKINANYYENIVFSTCAVFNE